MFTTSTNPISIIRDPDLFSPCLSFQHILFFCNPMFFQRWVVDFCLFYVVFSIYFMQRLILRIVNSGFQTPIYLLDVAMMKPLTSLKAKLLWMKWSVMNLFATASMFFLTVWSYLLFYSYDNFFPFFDWVMTWNVYPVGFAFKTLNWICLVDNVLINTIYSRESLNNDFYAYFVQVGWWSYSWCTMGTHSGISWQA